MRTGDFFMQRFRRVLLCLLLAASVLVACTAQNAKNKISETTVATALSSSVTTEQSESSAQESTVAKNKADKKQTIEKSDKDKKTTASSKNKKTTTTSKSKSKNKSKSKSKSKSKNTSTTSAAKKSGNNAKNTTNTQKSGNSSNNNSHNKTTAATATATTKLNVPDGYIACTLEIECKSVLDNKDKLKAGHEKYIPSNGVILANTNYAVKKGSTAYELLKQACDKQNIALNAESTVYGTYVAGINNLDEFDCGKESGWLYYVNGKTPNVSCGKYTLLNGDKVVFSYTCSY